MTGQCAEGNELNYRRALRFSLFVPRSLSQKMAALLFNLLANYFSSRGCLIYSKTSQFFNNFEICNTSDSLILRDKLSWDSKDN